MNISHNERRAHFHTFPLLYLFYSVCFYHGRSTLCLLPSLALPPSPTPWCSLSRAGCVPPALLAPSRGGIPPRRGAGSLGQGEQQREAKNPSSKGRGGRQVASERRAGRQRAGNNGSSVEHQRSPLSLSAHRPDASRAGAALCIPRVRTGEEWLGVQNWALGAQQHLRVVMGRCQGTGLLRGADTCAGTAAARPPRGRWGHLQPQPEKATGCKDGAHPDGQKLGSKAKS